MSSLARPSPITKARMGEVNELRRDQPRSKSTLRRWSLVVASSSVVEAVAVLDSLVRSGGGDRREQPNRQRAHEDRVSQG